MAGATTQAERQAQVLAAGYNGPLTDAAINQAYANAATPSDLASSGLTGYSPQTVAAANPAAPAPTVTAPASQLGQGINSLLGAIASGNKQAFDEAVRQFNATFGLDQQKFAESVRQYNEGLAVTQAGLTGTYGGATTQQAQQQAANIAAQAAGLTGYYTGNLGTGNIAQDAFAKASGDTRVTYLNASGGNLGEAANRYWQDVQGAIAQAGMSPTQFVYGTQGAPTMALQAMYGSNAAPTPGELTQAAIKQQADIIAQRNQTAQNWATLYGYTPQVDANGNPIFQAGTGAGPGAGTSTLAAQEQTYRQQLDAINAAAALQANPFRQQQVLGQLGRVLGGQGVAGFSAPNTVQGVGTAGGTGPNTGMAYMQQMIDDIRNPGANQASVNSVLEGIPTPNKINSADFLRSAPSTQSMILQGMSEKYGLDPADSLAQIRNTLPSFTAPSTFGQIKG